MSLALCLPFWPLLSSSLLSSPFPQPLPYSYGYQVSDASAGNAFSHRQRTDSSGVTSGRYTVRLPDGRTQTVTYTADHVHGYRATVEYSGEANHPDSGSAASRRHRPPVAQRPVRPRPNRRGRRRKKKLRRPRLLDNPFLPPRPSAPAPHLPVEEEEEGEYVDEDGMMRIRRQFYPGRIFKITRPPQHPLLQPLPQRQVYHHDLPLPEYRL